MEQTFGQSGATRGDRLRLILIAAAGLLVVSVVAILLVFLLPGDGQAPAPAGEDGGTLPAVVDGAAPPDAAWAIDLAPDHKPRPHGTRRITDRELRALLRRHRGLIN